MTTTTMTTTTTACHRHEMQGFTAVYSNLCDRMEQRNVFYACVIPFLLFFASFALIIYPNNGFLHPHALVDKIANILPPGFSAPLAIVRNWSFAMFYVLAEMWGSVVVSLLFWGFANEVTTVDEAKKYCTCGDCPFVFLCTTSPFGRQAFSCCFNNLTTCSLCSITQTPSLCCIPLFCIVLRCIPWYRPVVWVWCQHCPHLLWTVR